MPVPSDDPALRILVEKLNEMSAHVAAVHANRDAARRGMLPENSAPVQTAHVVEKGKGSGNLLRDIFVRLLRGNA